MSVRVGDDAPLETRPAAAATKAWIEHIAECVAGEVEAEDGNRKGAAHK